MPRKKPVDPLTVVNFRCPARLRDAFAAACLRNAIPATYVHRQLMLDYIKANPAKPQGARHD